MQFREKKSIGELYFDILATSTQDRLSSLFNKSPRTIRSYKKFFAGETLGKNDRRPPKDFIDQLTSFAKTQKVKQYKSPEISEKLVDKVLRKIGKLIDDDGIDSSVIIYKWETKDISGEKRIFYTSDFISEYNDKEDILEIINAMIEFVKNKADYSNQKTRLVKITFK